MNRTLPKLALASLALLTMAACSSNADAPSPTASETPVTEQVTLQVFAAASLTDAFTEIAGDFESANPGVKAEFNFAGS